MCDAHLNDAETGHMGVGFRVCTRRLNAKSFQARKSYAQYSCYICGCHLVFVVQVAAASAQITHAHVDAINGAILQAMCVEFALSSDETKGWKDCWTFLKEQAEKLESKKDTKK